MAVGLNYWSERSRYNARVTLGPTSRFLISPVTMKNREIKVPLLTLAFGWLASGIVFTERISISSGVAPAAKNGSVQSEVARRTAGKKEHEGTGLSRC